MSDIFCNFALGNEKPSAGYVVFTYCKQRLLPRYVPKCPPSVAKHWEGVFRFRVQNYKKYLTFANLSRKKMHSCTFCKIIMYL